MPVPKVRGRHSQPYLFHLWHEVFGFYSEGVHHAVVVAEKAHHVHGVEDIFVAQSSLPEGFDP